MTKQVTLYEIRLHCSYGTESLGKRKLRTLSRARRIAKRLHQMNVRTELHKWKINPVGLRIDRLTSLGWAAETTANKGSP